jgi:hypothetical protein
MDGWAGYIFESDAVEFDLYTGLKRSGYYGKSDLDDE